MWFSNIKLIEYVLKNSKKAVCGKTIIEKLNHKR